MCLNNFNFNNLFFFNNNRVQFISEEKLDLNGATQRSNPSSPTLKKSSIPVRQQQQQIVNDPDDLTKPNEMMMMMTTSSKSSSSSNTNCGPTSLPIAAESSKIPTSILINKMNENRRLNDSNQSIELPTNKYNDYIMKSNANARSMSCRSARTLPVQMNASQMTSMMANAMPSRNTSTSSSLLIAKTTNTTNSQPSSSRIPIKSILNKNYMLLNNSQDQVLPTSSMSSSCTMPVISLSKHNSLLATRKHFSSYAIARLVFFFFYISI